MNPIVSLKLRLEELLPSIDLEIDEPADATNGIWFLNVNSLIVQWKKDKGFGVSKVAGIYGEGCEEVYFTENEMLVRIVSLLEDKNVS